MGSWSNGETEPTDSCNFKHSFIESFKGQVRVMALLQVYKTLRTLLTLTFLSDIQLS